ncbi:P-loop containing nucleoside triphosphate hydrolase protein [Hypoxylon trugodes]|uniref:P-loop containing nucleoside triphosphate hydrolase protein n=1 Tax=Hypoxylon trugodes TaxID=326681 RepID=UPI0021A159A9|nr:P-loop containing nucleoside triphosphate hydrolase protein [Hypoxylon trugodes]KAI1382595.1 P-loop containing nucleoside triphosphate hydrolase protein [Hypoxylon trugodes]
MTYVNTQMYPRVFRYPFTTMGCNIRPYKGFNSTCRCLRKEDTYTTLIFLTGRTLSTFLVIRRMKTGRATRGDFAIIQSYWGQVTSPIQFFAALERKFVQTLTGIERLRDIMATRPTVADKTGAKPLVFRSGLIEFKGVAFRYNDNSAKKILKGVSFSVQPGTTIGIVGATGSGKSTILNLLSRFYDVTEGSVLIDGQDIRDVTLSRYFQTGMLGVPIVRPQSWRDGSE